MNVAFLEKVPQERNPRIKTLRQTFESNEGDRVALLKARTLLAFLWMNNLLKSEETPDGWVIFFGSSMSRDSVDSIRSMLPRAINDTPHAVIGMLYGKPSCQQPGVAAIRNDAETKSVFINAFLEESRRWLEQHEDEKAELLLTFVDSYGENPQLLSNY